MLFTAIHIQFDCRLEQVIDHDGRASDLDKIAHEMYQLWEEYIPEELEMTQADVNDVKTHHPQNLRLQL